MISDTATATEKYVFGSGVVALGRDANARVVSCRPSDCPVIGDKRYWNLLGVWNQSDREEIRLNLSIFGKEWIEGTPNPPYDISARLKRSNTDVDAKFANCIGISRYHFYAAHTHLRNLLRSYAKLTTVVGPQLPFEENIALIFNVPAPECYAHFDACLVALRAFADSIRFTVWNVLQRERGIPRSVGTLVSSDIPETLRQCIQRYLDAPFNEIQRYRDNAVHYAPFAARDNTRLIWSAQMIHAEIWVPINPEVRTHERFEYQQKDAFRMAKLLVEQTIEFADEFYAEIARMRMDHVRQYDE